MGKWEGEVLLSCYLPCHVKEAARKKAIVEGIAIKAVVERALCKELDLPYNFNGKKIVYWKYRDIDGNIKIDSENVLRGKVRKGKVMKSDIIGRVMDVGSYEDE